MIRILCVAIAVMAVALLPQRAAQAKEAPWCAVIGVTNGNMYWDCQYQSFEQCYPHILLGNRGFCNPNPAYQGPAAPPPKQPRGHARDR